MEDERQTELDCIAAIFPEIQIDPENVFCASIDIPVHPTAPVKVIFPAASDGGGALPTPPHSATSGQEREDTATQNANNVESHNLSYLPSISVRITLPEGYPEEKPAKFELSVTPEWLSRTYLAELEASGEQIWEEAGRSLVVFGYIDSLQQAAENAFGFSEGGRVLEIPQDYMISLLDYDIKATQAAFEKETFDCGVCLDPKKGTVCHRMVDCGHVFCVQCLQDFYNNAITEGDLASVRCLAPDCAKKREEARQATKKHRKPKIQLSPSELLQIPLEHDIVTRYVKLKHKAELESDKNTIYCPRKWCQGAARSKKHRKPAGFEDNDDSDDDSDAGASEDSKNFKAGRDLLAVCEDCSFAFCSRCYSSWHGEFTLCAPKAKDGELTEEDKASLEYLKLHTTPCPTCAAPAQKTHGCNHMICFKCNTHFCYLCSAWLEPGNPYKHYNEEKTGCYMRLWELEGGDGDDVGIGYAGGVREREVEIPPEIEEPGEEVAVDQVQDQVLHDIPEIVEPPEEPEQELQREGPLVLRINQLPPAPAPGPAVPDPPPAVGNVHRLRGARHHRGHPRLPPGGNGARRAPLVNPRRGQRNDERRIALDEEGNPIAQEAVDRAWIQMFVQMAMNDEEDLLEDDEEDGAAWEIPVR
jgi:E3 ubiquitin-protein ligase RNF14